MPTIDTEHLISNWGGSLLFCLGIYVVLFVLRRAVEWKWPAVRGKDTFWEDVALPSLPVLLGVLLAACIRNYPYPAIIQTLGGRIFFGMVCGFLSTWIYRLAKAVAKKLLADRGITMPDIPDGEPATLPSGALPDGSIQVDVSDLTKKP